MTDHTIENTGVTIGADGKIIVDMEKANALWQGLDPLAQANLTNMLFEPVLKAATDAKATILAITAERDAALACAEAAEAELERLRAVLRTVVSRAQSAKRDCEDGRPVSAYNLASGILGQIGSDVDALSKEPTDG